MAATVLSTAPLLAVFIIANRFFVQSVVTSGVKG
jgi:ABC-type glycerol-3-phosphate transport system permease component